MNMLYGYYKLNMNCEDYNLMLERMKNDLLLNDKTGLGVPIIDHAAYIENAPEGLKLLGLNERVVGLGFKNANWDRVWILPFENGHGIYFDGYPDIATNLGFKWDAAKKQLLHPNSLQVVLQL